MSKKPKTPKKPKPRKPPKPDHSLDQLEVKARELEHEFMTDPPLVDEKDRKP